MLAQSVIISNQQQQLVSPAHQHDEDPTDSEFRGESGYCAVLCASWPCSEHSPPFPSSEKSNSWVTAVSLLPLVPGIRLSSGSAVEMAG